MSLRTKITTILIVCTAAAVAAHYAVGRLGSAAEV